MDTSDKQSQRSSDSLFAERDVTHSVEAVKLCWEMEKARRRRLLLRVVLPMSRSPGGAIWVTRTPAGGSERNFTDSL